MNNDEKQNSSYQNFLIKTARKSIENDKKSNTGCLGHMMFFGIHMICLVLFFPLLLLTVPMHLIYSK